MLTIIVNNKNISCKLDTSIIQYENNIEKISCIIPKVYDDTSLINADVLMFYKNEYGEGGFIQLDKSEVDYNERYMQFYNKINSNITKESGKVTVWLKISDYESNFSFETTESSFTINEAKETPTSTSSNYQTYFDQWLIKMQQIQNKTLKIQNDVIAFTNNVRIEIENIKQEITKDGE